LAGGVLRRETHAFTIIPQQSLPSLSAVAQTTTITETPRPLATVTFARLAPATQAGFERAVAMLHSIWFDQADAAFADVAQTIHLRVGVLGPRMTAMGNPMARVVPRGTPGAGIAWARMT